MLLVFDTSEVWKTSNPKFLDSSKLLSEFKVISNCPDLFFGSCRTWVKFCLQGSFFSYISKTFCHIGRSSSCFGNNHFSGSVNRNIYDNRSLLIAVVLRFRQSYGFTSCQSIIPGSRTRARTATGSVARTCSQTLTTSVTST